MVLAPTSNTFKLLSSVLRIQTTFEAAFLIDDKEPPVAIVSVEAHNTSPSNTLILPYDFETSLQWLMFGKIRDPQLDLSITYSVESILPADQLLWDLRVQESRWSAANFNDWKELPPARFGSITSNDSQSSGSGVKTGSPQRLAWAGFSQELADLKASFSFIETLGNVAELHPEAVEQVRQWQPPSDPQFLYCAYLRQADTSEDLAVMRILLAVDAFRRQQAQEVPFYFAGQVLSIPGSHYSFLQKLGAALQSYSPSRSVLASQTLPAGFPGPRSTSSAPQEGPPGTATPQHLTLRFNNPAPSLTYKISLIPHPVRDAKLLEELTTLDDSDLAYSNQTYRFGSLIESLAATHLERLGLRGNWTVYVTVPD